MKIEPIYQLQFADGSWIDQAKHSYDCNVKNSRNAVVRVVYTESQLRQLGEACAAIVNKADPYGDTITEIRKLLKELL